MCASRRWGGAWKYRRPAVTKDAAGIDEGERLETVLLGNSGDGALQFSCCRPVHPAADVIHGRAGSEIARTEAVGRKPSHHRWTAEEGVHQRHLLTAPARDVAALRAHHADH